MSRMKAGDLLVYDSNKMTYKGKEPCQMFTAIANLPDDLVESVNFQGATLFRRKAEYFKAQQASIHSLIEDLSFIKNKEQWGYPFRFGLISIPQEDFERIVLAMNANLPDNLDLLQSSG